MILLQFFFEIAPDECAFPKRVGHSVLGGVGTKQYFPFARTIDSAIAPPIFLSTSKRLNAGLRCARNPFWAAFSSVSSELDIFSSFSKRLHFKKIRSSTDLAHKHIRVRAAEKVLVLEILPGVAGFSRRHFLGNRDYAPR